VNSIPTSDFRKILRTLSDHRVDFLVVGGVGAVLLGAPVTTFDLDVVHSRAEENLLRLGAALEALGAVYRAQPDRRLRPGAAHLRSDGHHLLMTAYGPLDLLGTIGHDRAYEDLIDKTCEADLGGGLRVRILNLETLIAVKEETAGAKDLAVLPVLRRTLLEKQKRTG
jgi:predicted nucleotidyltransferase